MSGITANSTHRVLVTGSRGKSSVVRMLHTALLDAGLQSYARITGVMPRELGPTGVRGISRSSGAHVEEMRWWLKRLPVSADAIVLENSAIAVDLQDLAGKWLQPGITVFTNALPDHQEVWGPTRTCATQVLTSGIPKNGRVILPAGLWEDSHLLELLAQRQCQTVFAQPAHGIETGFRTINLGLALVVIEELGMATSAAIRAMLALKQDKFDFNVVHCAGAKLAMAFSANDITSTMDLFRTLSWSKEETRLIYNHRRDRPGRFDSFLNWLNDSDWREVMIIGDKPPLRKCSARYLRLKNGRELLQQFQPGERVFGCGNIAGAPLSLTAVLN